MWSIVTDRAKRDGGWDADQFFASGRATIDELWRVADGLGLPAHRRRALDLGCGLGRLTRALAVHVDAVLGLDISPSMIEQAQRLHAAGQVPAGQVPAGQGVTFAVHDADDLRGHPDGSFDVVCCLLVLQHLPSVQAIEGHLGELVRVLAPGGLLMLQLTTALPPPVQPRGLRARLRLRTRLGTLLRAAGVGPAVLARVLGWRPPMPMTAMPDERARAVLAASGARVAWACPRDLGGGERDCIYLVTR